MRCKVLLSGLLCLFFIPFGGLSAADDAGSGKTIDDIVLLSRSGRDLEAIAIYESLPDDADLSLVVMRAVAGCYWREKQFDRSRELYKKILDNRPTLNRLSDNPKPEPSVSAAPAAKSVTKPVEKAVAKSVSKADAKRSAEMEAELKKLREANALLEKEREELRRKTEARIADVTSAAELSIKETDKLRAELADAREKRKAAESVSAQIQNSIKDQKGELVSKVALLEESLNKARAEVSGLEAGRKAEVAKLEKALAEEKKAREELSKKAEEKIAGVKSAAQESAKGVEELQGELAAAQEKCRIAESLTAEMRQSIEKQTKASAVRVAELEKSLKAARMEVSGLQENRKAEVDRLEKALAEEQQARKKLEKMSQEIQVSLEKSSTEMRAEIVSLEDELKLAEMEVEQSRLDAAKSIEESRNRTAELTKKISELEGRSKSVNYEIASLSKALEDARLKNAELSAKRANEELETSGRMDEIEKTALSLALAEIDALEREYMELDAQAGERQDELLGRIDRLEQSTVTGESDLKDVRRQLELERLLRKEIEAQSEKRDGMLLDANRILAESTEKIAKQFDAFRAQSGAGKLRDNTRRQADLAPLISKLEEATKSAALEVKALNSMLSEERRKHEESARASKKEIVRLRRQVESLNQEIEVLKTADAELEAKWAAETERKLAEMRKAGDAREAELKAASAKQLAELNAAHDARVAELGKEIVELGDKIKVSSEALAQAKEALTTEKGRYAELVKTTSESEAKLKKRIHDLELAFALPETTENRPAVSGVSQGDPELDTKVDDLYQSIIDTSRRDKSLSLVQYESLPADSEKPTALIKTIANVYRDKKEYDKAYKMYEEILARNPGDLYAERKLVMTLFDLGRYDEALARLSGKGKTGSAAETGASQSEESAGNAEAV